MTDEDELCAMGPIAPPPPPPPRPPVKVPEPDAPLPSWGVWDQFAGEWVATGAGSEREAFGLLIAADHPHQGELALAVGVPPHPPETSVRPHRKADPLRPHGWPKWWEDPVTVGPGGKARRKEACEECEDGECPTCSQDCPECDGRGWVWIDADLPGVTPPLVAPGQGVLVA